MKFAHRLKPTHLRLIVETARHQKLNVAAEQLGMSQPAASRILSDIETQVGAELFIRHPRWMEPTPIGEAFLKHARAVLMDLESLETELESLSKGYSGDLRVGSVTGPAVGLLVPAIRKIKADSPDIEATIEIAPSTQLVRRLKEGELDFIIGRLAPDDDRKEFRVHPARTEVVALIVRREHPLAGKPKVTLAELANFEWVMQERGAPIRHAVEDAFVNSDAPTPTYVSNSSSLVVALTLLAQSDTVAPVSEEVATLLTGAAIGANLAKLRLEQTITVSPFYVIENRAQPLSRVAERVLAAVLAEFRD